MSNKPLVGVSGDPIQNWEIPFNLRASLSRPIQQPVIVDDPVGLAVFGDSSNIFLGFVSDPGASVYPKLPNIKAKTYIHGWTVSSGWIYVLDGVELIAFDLRTGFHTATIALLKGNDAQTATDALARLKNAQQKVEWATLLELAEEEWVRVTAEQAAATPGSAKRDEMDTIATDFFRMLKELREITGCTGGGGAARQLVADLRKALATERAAAAPWCFSPPITRRRMYEESQRAVFTVQGNGTLYAIDKAVTDFVPFSTKNHAELHLTLLEDLSSSIRLLTYVSNGTLQLVDAKTFADVSSWTPETKPANGTTHTLSTVKGQIWWGTDSAVYACQADNTGKLTPTWKSGVPWTERQVGRLNAPATIYKPPVEPNELFDTMNVRTWIEQRSKALNDGMLALLALSDEAGRYTSPPAGTSYIVRGPFERDAGSSASRWTQVKPHHSGSLILLTDNRGASSFCRYPLAANTWQLVPHWTVAPWFFAPVTLCSAFDQALSQGWPTAVPRVTKPHADMVGWLRTARPDKVTTLGNLLPSLQRKLLDEQLLRLILWYALLEATHPEGYYNIVFQDAKNFLDAIYDANVQKRLKETFGKPGTQWELFAHDEYIKNFRARAECPVNFDTPYINKSIPANLFHSRPPLWYDPWGYNRPGDFIASQPEGSFIDPFCFDGQLRVPQRPIKFDTAFKLRSWAVFTDNDPSTILRSVKPPAKDGTPAPEPKTLQAAGDPNVLVVTADEDRQRSTFRVLPPKQLRVTFDAASHTLRNEMPEFLSIGSQVLTSPVMYLNPASPVGSAPTAWCVTTPNFPSTRLRTLAKADADGVSPWDKFVDEKSLSPQCASTGTKTWKIDTCPLPTSVLPLIVLLGFGVPKPTA